MLDSLRLFVLSSLYYFGFTYAAFTALEQRVTSEEEVGVSAPSSPHEQGSPRRRTRVVLGLPALKLMIMLTTMALFSFVGAECLPLFAELRVIFMYTLLFSPAFTQQEIYDQVFAPLLVRGGTLALSLQTTNFISRKVPLFVTRRCVDLGIAAMNHAQRNKALDQDAVRDILSGLVFSQRALQQVADLSREADGATYAEIARDSNFAVGVFTSRVKRALLNEHEEDEVHTRAPTGRVVRGEEEDRAEGRFARGVPTATASAFASSVGSRASDGLVESIHSERDYEGGGGERRRGDRTRRDKRKKHNFWGLF